LHQRTVTAAELAAEIERRDARGRNARGGHHRSIVYGRNLRGDAR
jgi:hypothetical protein